MERSSSHSLPRWWCFYACAHENTRRIVRKITLSEQGQRREKILWMNQKTIVKVFASAHFFITEISRKIFAVILCALADEQTSPHMLMMMKSRFHFYVIFAFVTMLFRGGWEAQTGEWIKLITLLLLLMYINNIKFYSNHADEAPSWRRIVSAALLPSFNVQWGIFCEMENFIHYKNELFLYQ